MCTVLVSEEMRFLSVDGCGRIELGMSSVNAAYYIDIAYTAYTFDLSL